ncbi:MAG: ABC transporter permease [Chloroflexi bacterium]|nr:ABC transporter permease [Chloroflexota bacterium]
MRLFWELTKRSFRRALTYRAAAIAGLTTNFFFGLFRVAVLLALYGNRQNLAGITIPGAITYIGLTQAVIAFVNMFGSFDLMHSVHSGEVGSDLLKPMNFFTFWLAKDFGGAVVNLFSRGIVFMALFELVYDLSYPETAVQWLLIFISLMLSWLVSFSWRFLINLTAFWTPNAVGIGRFGFVVSWFFSGFLMPLRLFPDWVRQLAHWTPFPSMLNTVVEVYLGVATATETAVLILTQLAWAIGLILMGQIALKTGVRRLVILGG